MAKNHLLHRHHRRRNTTDCDIDRYFCTETIVYDEKYGGPFDLLGWWRENRFKYPTMARVARDYLAIPATSTSCERLFSGLRDTLGIRRHCLNADSMSALQFLKSFITEGPNDIFQ